MNNDDSCDDTNNKEVGVSSNSTQPDGLIKGTDSPDLDLVFFTYIINTVADPIFVKNDKHQWIVMNDALCAFMGLPREKLIGKSDFDFFPKEEAKIFWKTDDEVFATGIENINEEKLTNNCGDKHVISTKKSVFIHPDTGQKFLVGVIRDITRTKRIEKKLQKVTEELKELAVTDEMTGLANRRQFYNIAEHVLSKAKRNKKGILVLFADMDKLKHINDKYGHLEGDSSIVEIASILKDTLRESDVIARMGGDEFVILLSDVTSTCGEKAIERLNKAMQLRNLKHHTKYQLSLSIGYAFAAHDDDSTVEDLIDKSDKSMYEQKKKNKG